MLRVKILNSTPEAWLGRPLRDISEGDMWRWWALRTAAAFDYSKDEAE